MSPTKSPNAEAIDLQFKFMKEQFEDHRNDTNKRFDRLDSRFDNIESLIRNGFAELPNIYATKEDHKLNKARIDSHDKLIGRLAWGSFFGLIGIIATIIGIDKYL